MEICVPQRTENWHRWRRKAIVTASRFADAVGLGSGKAFEYFLACTSKGEYSPLRTCGNEFTRHGIETEPIIDEMYRLLTGRTTRSAGFCLPAEDDVLHGLSGCSPDGKVLDANGDVVGLVEYKAPVFRNYTVEKHPPHGIPRRYMAQIQGEMGICRLPWCDFMSVCRKTREISLFRVHFQSAYYAALARRIVAFCSAVQDWRLRHSLSDDNDDNDYDDGEDIESIAAVRQLKNLPPADRFLNGEDEIKVDRLLTTDHWGRYRTWNGMWMSFDFLVGESGIHSRHDDDDDDDDDVADRRRRRMTDDERRKVVDEIDFELALTIMDIS